MTETTRYFNDRWWHIPAAVIIGTLILFPPIAILAMTEINFVMKVTQ